MGLLGRRGGMPADDRIDPALAHLVPDGDEKVRSSVLRDQRAILASVNPGHNVTFVGAQSALMPQPSRAVRRYSSPRRVSAMRAKAEWSPRSRSSRSRARTVRTNRAYAAIASAFWPTASGRG